MVTPKRGLWAKETNVNPVCTPEGKRWWEALFLANACSKLTVSNGDIRGHGGILSTKAGEDDCSCSKLQQHQAETGHCNLIISHLITRPLFLYPSTVKSYQPASSTP